MAPATLMGAPFSPGAFNPACINIASPAIFSKLSILSGAEYRESRKSLSVSIAPEDGGGAELVDLGLFVSLIIVGEFRELPAEIRSRRSLLG